MKIEEVKIHNWRSIRDETISFEDLMILIGQNNHGKSNILSAILFFFGEIGLDPLDFCIGTDDLYIEIKFALLDENDKTTFKKYLTASNNMRIRKIATKQNGFSYHGYVESPTENWLKEDNISDYTKRDIAEHLPLAHLLPTSGRITKDIFREVQVQYIQERKDTLPFEYQLETGPFLGAKNVAKGIFGEVYFVPSVKKAADDLATKGRSTFSELYARVINKMSQTNEGFKDAKNRIASLICILNRINEDGTENTSRPPELTAFEQSLQSELDNWNTTIDVEIIPPDLDDVFKVGATVWINDGIRTDVTRKGQGLQRALIFALVRSLAKLTRQERDARQESEVQETVSRQASKSTYFILEEPELYLHPQAQRELFDSLLELSRGESQVVLCTHSSSFISLDHYRSICIVRKNTVEEGTTIFQCTEELFPEANDKRIFNTTYWINPDRGELFFARKVLLVEGQTDKTVISLLAKNLGVFRYDYTLIDCGSKDSIPSYLQLLNKFRIPYVAVYDRDHQAGKSADAIASADRASQRIEDNLDSALGRGVVLDNDVEEEIGVTDPSKKNKPYLALTHVEAEGFSISDTLKGKIETVYT
ncbi:MAG: AAA family ATPase [Planctomycetes bacterium]|nr:AAA family ATPase [Planctomycetota bacterium]